MSAFQFLEDNENFPIGNQHVKLHMVSEVNIYFMRKNCLVAGGHMTKRFSSLTYYYVVSRESVRIFLLLAELNDLGVLSCDIENTYLNSYFQEKIWTTSVPYFIDRKGKKILVARALYGL